LNQSGQNYSELITGANNLISAESNFGQQALTAASALQTGIMPTYQNMPAPNPLSNTTNTQPSTGIPISGTTLIIIGALILLYIMIEK
jgi:hypothetical protein